MNKKSPDRPCSRCQCPYESAKFLILPTGRRHSWCDDCRKEYHGEKGKAWANENSERMRNLQREAAKRNAVPRAAATKRWRSNNKEHVKLYGKVYKTERRATDPEFKLLDNLRNRMRAALKNNYKTSSTCDLTGCSMRALRLHLESLFKPGMTWGNYGEWHVDHKKPCVSFDMSSPQQQRECFHFSNLQPLWAEENCKKNRYV